MPFLFGLGLASDDKSPCTPAFASKKSSSQRLAMVKFLLATLREPLATVRELLAIVRVGLASAKELLASVSKPLTIVA